MTKRTPKIGDQVFFVPTPSQRLQLGVKVKYNVASRKDETTAPYEVTKLAGTICYVHPEGTVNVSYLLPSCYPDKGENLYLHQEDPLPEGVGGYCIYRD
jgi:hypothetical protein